MLKNQYNLKRNNMDSQLVLKYANLMNDKFYFERIREINGKKETEALAEGSIKTYVEGPKGKNNRFFVFSTYPNKEVIDASDTKAEAVKIAYERALLIKDRLMKEFRYEDFIDKTPFSSKLSLESRVSF